MPQRGAAARQKLPPKDAMKRYPYSYKSQRWLRDLKPSGSAFVNILYPDRPARSELLYKSADKSLARPGRKTS